MRFEELDISDELLDALDCMGFETCAPIQEQAIPLVLEGRDLIAIAQTGTGKTAAYLLPVIDLISEGGYPTDAINCIVMAPTRELAQQIDRQMEGFAYYLPVSSIAVYGGGTGEEFGRQQKGLKMGADVVIATPGRLLAHLAGGQIDLSRVGFFILDEADRMLDMGFYDDIMQIARQLPKERQTLLFSATMPPKIKQLAGNILNDPAEVKIAVSRPADKIDQGAVLCYEPQKTAVLEYLVKQEQNPKVIVFASSKLKVKELTRTLRRHGLKVAEMHSDLDQAQRDDAMLDFKAGRVGILVATDIVARGIDIDDISLVINYDVPRTAEDYVHRVGRTARANADGKAVTLVSTQDRRKFASIEGFLRKQVRRIDIPASVAELPAEGPHGSASEAPSRGSRPSGKGPRNQGGKSHSGRGRSDKSRSSSRKPRPQQATPPPSNAPQNAPASPAGPSEASAAPKSKPKRRWHHRGPKKPPTAQQ